jgi:hypothetical protein
MGGSRKQFTAGRFQTKPKGMSTAEVEKAREGIGLNVDAILHGHGTDRR